MAKKNKKTVKKVNTAPKKFGEIDHVCPYCDGPIRHNILKFSNKHVCENCGTELFIHLKNGYTLITAVIGFPLILMLMYLMGFRQTNFIIEIIVLAVLAYIYSGLASLLVCKIKGPQKVYVVDPIDPTVLNRKSRR